MASDPPAPPSTPEQPAINIEDYFHHPTEEPSESLSENDQPGETHENTEETPSKFTQESSCEHTSDQVKLATDHEPSSSTSN